MQSAPTAPFASRKDSQQHLEEGEDDDEDDSYANADNLDNEEEEEEDIEEEEDSVDAEISTAGTDWGEQCLSVTLTVLEQYKDDLALYSYRALPKNKRIDIRIDKLSDRYGSPSLDEVESFSRSLVASLEDSMGEEEAGQIEIEVSSPGAERQVKIPLELSRFAELPMKVLYRQATAGSGGEQGIELQILQFINLEDKTTGSGGADDPVTFSMWKLADVKANRTGKGRPLNKKQRETVIEINLADIEKIYLHVDM